jgi:hypothetical protein
MTLSKDHQTYLKKSMDSGNVKFYTRIGNEQPSWSEQVPIFPSNLNQLLAIGIINTNGQIPEKIFFISDYIESNSRDAYMFSLMEILVKEFIRCDLKDLIPLLKLWNDE